LELFFENHKIDEFSQIVGIREIRIENWVWYLNNKRIFIRGVNYIPTQWLSEFNEKMLEKDLNLIENANINAIRVHGHINRKELYQECDKKGILVWQDFALQWSYSKADSFIAKAVVQIREMVWYLMSHPSIVVWCCHNEPSDNLKKLTPFLYHALKSTDTSRHIEMSSDLETHPYPGWYYGDYHEFSGLPCSPMITEFGAQALPNKESLMKFIPEKKMWPPDWKFWAYHDFRYEQTFNVAEIDLGNSIDEFIKNSQDYQAELLKYSIENYRRAKHNPTAGLFQFMFVDCWPSITWSVLDYYRKPKKGYEILKRAYQPVLVSLQVKRGPIIGSTINNDGTVQMFAFWDPRQAVWITNDLYKEFKNCILKIEIVNKSDKSYGEKKFKIDILPDSSKVVWHPKRFEKAIKFKKPLRAGKYFVKLTVYEKNKKILSRNYTEIRLMRSENSV
jgi:beta-mannosidase